MLRCSRSMHWRSAKACPTVCPADISFVSDVSQYRSFQLALLHDVLRTLLHTFHVHMLIHVRL